MATFTAIASGKANEAGTWDKVALVPGAEDEIVMGGSFEVKMDATLSVLKVELKEKGKINLSKALTVTGTGVALKASGETSVTQSATGKFTLAVAAGSTMELSCAVDMKVVLFQGSATSKYKLTEKLTASTSVTLKAGIITTSNNEISVGSFFFESATAKELVLGSSVIKCSATGESWQAGTGVGLTIKAETSTIELTNTEATFSAASLTYNILTFTGKVIKITGSGTFTTINFSLTGTESERSVEFTEAATITFTTITKSAGTQKWASNKAATAYKLKKASGTLSVEQVLLKDSTAEGGATFTDIKTGAETTNVSGNTGWTFETVSASSVVPLMVF